MSLRRRLPDRRPCETFEFETGGRKYVCSVGRFADGTVGEIFLTNHRVNSQAGIMASNQAVLASLALQHRRFASNTEQGGNARRTQIQKGISPMNFFGETLGEQMARSFQEKCDELEGIRVKTNTGDPRSAQNRALELTFFDECSDTAPKRWLIKGVIARGETSSWIAPPGRGKSALHSDISVHLAADINWRGHLTKGPVGVVYFAFERADLVKRRNTAYAKRLDLKGLPIAIAAQIINLMDPSCVDVILATIHAAANASASPSDTSSSIPSPKASQQAAATRTKPATRTNASPICAACTRKPTSTSPSSATPERTKPRARADPTLTRPTPTSRSRSSATTSRAPA